MPVYVFEWVSCLCTYQSRVLSQICLARSRVITLLNITRSYERRVEVLACYVRISKINETTRTTCHVFMSMSLTKKNCNSSALERIPVLLPCLLGIHIMLS